MPSVPAVVRGLLRCLAPLLLIGCDGLASLAAVPQEVQTAGRAFVTAVRVGDTAAVREKVVPRVAADPRLGDVVRSGQAQLDGWDDGFMTRYSATRTLGKPTVHHLIYIFGPDSAGTMELWVEEHQGTLLVETFRVASRERP